MRPAKLNYNCTTAQRFFVEKTFELLHKWTLDSYRVRINNPYTLLKELVEVLDDIRMGRLKNSDYGNVLIKETERLLKDSDYLNWNTMNREYFISLLSKNNSGKTDFQLIATAANIIIKESIDYTKCLFEKIILAIQEFDTLLTPTPEKLSTLDKLCEFLYVQLIFEGYSKSYLLRFFSGIFSANTGKSFDERFAILVSLKDKPNQEYSVVFALDHTAYDVQNVQILGNDFSRLEKSERQRIYTRSNDKIRSFLNKNNKNQLIVFKTQAKDYYSALTIGKSKLQSILDVLHLGHHKENISPGIEAMTIGSNLSKADTIQLKFQIDGFFKSGQDLYRILQDKMILLDSLQVKDESKNKIRAGIRYLRLGAESKELESKLLNYWIGLEYLFSVYEADSYTVGRLRDFFPKAHTLIYAKRLLKQFHDDIQSLSLHSLVPNYNVDLEYLKVDTSYDPIINQIQNYPLLAYRAHLFKSWIKPKTLYNSIEKHRQNLDWNLTRIYRIRNEIVHNAATKSNIENVVSHLRYYLTFILNSMIDFFIDTPKDYNRNNELDIADYFLLQEIKYKSFIYKDITVQKALAISNPMEIFS